MGQKVHPNGIRLKIVKRHNSVWYAEGANYAKNLINDLQVRRYIEDKLAKASISKIVIQRSAQAVKVIIHAARPGIIIGKKGEGVDKLRQELTKKVGLSVQLNIEEVRKPDIDAQLVAQSIAGQLERRVMFRRAMKRAVQNAMRQNAQGIMIKVGGRLGGVDIARKEWCREGRVPLHTLRADIDYATCEAATTYGIIGVKVWIFKGEVLGDIENTEKDAAEKTKKVKTKAKAKE